MNVSLVLTIIGDDRPGLVEAVSSAVNAHGGNWEESRMAHLAGKFAGILLVQAPQERVDALKSSLRELGQRGLNITIEESTVSEQAATGATAVLELVGHDRPGIVRDISHAIARRSVNVEELRTERSSAPMSGEMLFKATIRLRFPPHLSPAQIRQELEPLAAALMVDITLSEGA